MGVDACEFDQGRQAIARRLRSLRLRLLAVRTFAFSLLAAVLVFGGAAALRDGVLGLGSLGWALGLVFLATLFALLAAVELPFSYVSGFRWERAMGLSTQTLAGWLKDLAKSFALGLGSIVVAGAVLLWLLSAEPTWWWLVAWAVGLVVAVVLGFLTPILLVPLFYRFRPLEDAGLRARFEALAARARVPVVGVFELQASAKTRRSNAAVMGFGRTRRIVVTDTLLRDFPPEEIETVLAHELAHQRYVDPVRGFLLGATVSLVTLFVTSWLYRATYASFGVRAVGDMAGLPLLAVLLGLVSLPVRPLELWWSRRREARADRFSLELTRNPVAFASAMVRLHDRNLGLADPRRWEKWLFYSHPTGRERVELSRVFAASRA